MLRQDPRGLRLGQLVDKILLAGGVPDRVLRSLVVVLAWSQVLNLALGLRYWNEGWIVSTVFCVQTGYFLFHNSHPFVEQVEDVLQ